AAIGCERAGECRCERLSAVAAIGAGVGDQPDLYCGKSAVGACAERYSSGHLMAGSGADELLLACELPSYRPPGLQCGEHAKIFGQHLLLAAKTAAHPLGEYMHVPRAQTEDVAEL